MSEGEGSPLRPARRLFKMMVVSSESESDESVSVPRRKRMRVLSDEGASSSSSSGSAVVARRRRVLPALRDSGSDTSDWATDHSDSPSAPTVALSASKPAASGFASDSSEGNSDKCSICLLRFKDQEIGTPESCEHIFCVDCIVEWSKNVNTCPVDRMTFNSIVVRTRVGGRVLRTEAVKVMNRRPSVEVLVVEDPTPCEICGRTENEETMLLCDGCDLGFHMQCLTPALTEVPRDQWLCPSCDELLDAIHLSELDELFSGLDDFELPDEPRAVPLREPRTVRRSARNQQTDGPSTSSGRTSGRAVVAESVPSTSRGARRGRSSRPEGSRAPRRRATGTTRRKAPRRRTNTVIVEYELQGDGKFPITKTVKRKVKKRKRRSGRPRTAARRSHVRASVRARLADLRLQPPAQAQALQRSGAQQLSLSRQRAGIPALSLFGDPHTLDYFSEEEFDVAEGTSVAVAARPNRSAISAYRQARRKMVSIPSPVHAAAAPDILSSILESQTLLHSKKSILSISVDGQVDIKLEKRERPKRESLLEKRADPPGGTGRLDLTKGEDAAKKAPAYGGGHQRSGGWGGGYRGGRVPPAAPLAQHYGTQGSAPGLPGAAGARPGPAPPYGPAGADYSRRPPYAPPEQLYDRVRPPSSRAPFPPRAERGRYSGPVWRTDFPRDYNDAAPARHSFGGFDNPLDMRTGPPGPLSSAPATPEMSNSNLTSIRPLPEPPRFYFGAKPDEEEEASELVIDTDKYDPTEPTQDDDSSDEDERHSPPAPAALPIPPLAPPVIPVLVPPVIPVPLTAASELLVPDLLIPGLLTPRLPTPAHKCPPPPRPPPAVQSILAEMDTDSLHVPPNVLDSAVRRALAAHRQHLTDAPAPRRTDYSGEDSDGDCPNFSIYSATSVHIASTSNMEEISNAASAAESPSSRTKEEEYNEKVSKRCPITTNTRNAIKIKINSPVLIKRPASVYEDEEDEPEDDEGVNDPTEPATPESDPQTPEKQSIVSEIPEEEPPKKPVDIADDTKLDDLREDDNDGKSDDVRDDDNVEKPDDVRDDEHIGKPDDVRLGDNNEKPEDLKENNKIEEEAEVESKETEEDTITPEPPEEEAITFDSNDAELLKSQRGLEEDKQDPPEAEGETALENGDVALENEDTAFDIGVTALEDGVIVLDSEETALENEDKPNEQDRDDTSEKELELLLGLKGDAEKDVEKMTESISETEDERSYTPCLDENKSKDTSFETEKDKGIEGLDTEMISEEEGQDMFSDEQELTPPIAHSPPAPAPAPADDVKKKKKKEPKKESKEKKIKTKKSEVTFKKLSKTSKDRNYRDKEKNKDKDTDKSKKEKSDAAERKAKRKEKRKDLERYDVRTLVSEKRKRVKDAFGRDVSPARSRSGSAGSGRPASRRRRRDEPEPRRDTVSPRRKSSSPRRRSISPRRRSIVRKSVSPRRPSISPRRRSISPRRRSISPRRRSISPRRRSISPRRRSISPRRRSISPRRRSISPRRSMSLRHRRSMSSRVVTSAPSPSVLKKYKKSNSPKRKSISPPRRSPSRGKKRRSTSRPKKRRRSASRSPGPRPKGKKKKRLERLERADSPAPAQGAGGDPKRKRKRVRRGGRSPSAPPPPAEGGWSPPPSVDSRLLSPRTPPPGPEPARRRHRRRAAAATSQPSKEVFTSGDNILVSVSFNDEERARNATDKRLRRAARKERRKRRRRAAAAQAEAVKPVAIIDLERSPFRELTPSPKNVIVLSDSDHGEAAAERERRAERNASPPAPAPADHTHVGPKTPPEPSAPVKFTIASLPVRAPAANPLRDEAEGEAGEGGGGSALGPSTPPDSPAPYDPFEPTRSCSPSPPEPPPAPGAASPPSPTSSPPRATMTLEAAQKTNMSADDVIARRPVSPIEKVMALLQSTRDVSPEPPPGDAPPPHAAEPPAPAPALALPPPASSAPPPTGAAAPRIVLPSPTRSAPPKLFLAKPSPIKSNPVKPMPASQPSRLPLPLSAVLPRGPQPDDSPYSPGSSDFGDLFEPPPLAPRRHDSFDALFDKPARRRGRSAAAKVPVRLNKKRGKTQVGVKVDEDNLKILDDLPSSAVEMEVKSKFLKKLNRQERVVEEVKLVLKPHYNKKHVSKEEYKDILRRAVPKICHNKTGEINPSKIQALVEAYVKRIRKKHKLGLA